MAERAIDFAAVCLGMLLSLRVAAHWKMLPASNFGAARPMVHAALYAAIFVALLDWRDEYRPSFSLLAIRETERWLQVSWEAALAATLATYLWTGFLACRFAVLSLVLPLPLLVAEKLALRGLARAVADRGWGIRRALILGAGPSGQKTYAALCRSPKFGLKPVAFVDEEAAFDGVEIREPGYRSAEPARVLAGPITARLFHNLAVSALVIAAPELTEAEQQDLATEAVDAEIQTYIVSKDFAEAGFWIRSSAVDGVQLNEYLCEEPRPTGVLSKRVFDVLGSLAGLAVTCPAMLVTALVVKLTSRGPVLFRQQRVGQHGREFTIYKFRTMHCERAPQGIGAKGADDWRLTPVGAFLRRWNLDELPQLLNILVGDMSLVGPRPETVERDRFHSGVARCRLALKPGLTGLWQLSAARNQPIFQNTEYDVYYLKNRNLFMDLAILLHTARFGWRGI